MSFGNRFSFADFHGLSSDKIMRRQLTTTSTAIIPTFPSGYPDQFFPDPVSFSFRHPTKRLLFESQMMSLISPNFLQIDDVTIFSSFRKDAFCTITDSKEKVLMLAHKSMAVNFQLPFYKRNKTIIQNGFTITVKNMDGACIFTFKRKTIHNSKETDVLEIWFGNEVIPVGRIRKPALLNEYTVFDEYVHPLYVIHKAQCMTNHKDANKEYKYVIQKIGGDREIVGQINCKGQKGLRGEYPCSIQLRSDLSVTHKSIFLGALASRANSDRSEEKSREALELNLSLDTQNNDDDAVL